MVPIDPRMLSRSPAGGTIPATPMIPPQIRAQQAPAIPQSVFLQSGVPGTAQPGAPDVSADPLSALEAKLSELEQWAGEFKALAQTAYPPIASLLYPIAKAGQVMQQMLGDVRARAEAGGAAPPGQGEAPTPNPSDGLPRMA
jgi:hypothetical protein